MGLLTVLMWLVGIAACSIVFLSFFGAVSLENDKEKANRYLAGLHDRDAAR